MTLSQVVESYIAYKRSLGKDFKSKAANAACLCEERRRRRYKASKPVFCSTLPGRQRSSDR